jgi:hypothetical protein
MEAIGITCTPLSVKTVTLSFVLDVTTPVMSLEPGSIRPPISRASPASRIRTRGGCVSFACADENRSAIKDNAANAEEKTTSNNSQAVHRIRFLCRGS